MYNILGNLSTAMGYVSTMWSYVINFIKETDYLLVCLVFSLVTIGFGLLASARGVADGEFFYRRGV